MSQPNYSSHFSHNDFYTSLVMHIKKLGRDALLVALQLYFAAKDPMTPAWARAVICSALGYFILPIDAVPDVIPGIGLSDDIMVMAAALGTVASHVTKLHKLQANQWLQNMANHFSS